MSKRTILGIVALMTILTAGQLALADGAPPNIVANSSFELPGTSWYAAYSSGQSIGGWVVGPGSGATVVSNTYWAASDGTQSLDLNLFGPGSVYQDLVTDPSQQYAISFDLNKNPYGAGGDRQLLVTFGGFSWIFTINSFGAWQHIEIPWTAVSGPVTRITFTALSGDTAGVVIDNVSVIDGPTGPGTDVVVETPEPASLILFGTGFMALSGAIRKRFVK